MQKCCGSVYHKLDTYNFSLLPLYVISTCPQGRHLTFPNLLKATFQWSDAMLCHGNKSDRWSAKSCWPLLGTLCSLKICWEELTVHPKWKIDAWKKKKFSWVLLCKAIKNQLARKCWGRKSTYPEHTDLPRPPPHMKQGREMIQSWWGWGLAGSELQLNWNSLCVHPIKKTLQTMKEKASCWLWYTNHVYGFDIRMNFSFFLIYSARRWLESNESEGIQRSSQCSTIMLLVIEDNCVPSWHCYLSFAPLLPCRF